MRVTLRENARMRNRGARELSTIVEGLSGLRGLYRPTIVMHTRCNTQSAGILAMGPKEFVALGAVIPVRRDHLILG